MTANSSSESKTSKTSAKSKTAGSSTSKNAKTTKAQKTTKTTDAKSTLHSSALYRKYRPTRLEDVVGQPQVTEPLINAVKNHKLSHAYLFIGPRGTGKTSVARILAHAANDFAYEIEDQYLDIVEIDAASNTGVDNIRELREKAVIAPTAGRYKVYIIDEIHMLSKSAANALLKTLEEPPEHVIFIMATTDAHKVPITISSRAQVFTFSLADPKVMFSHLRQISDQESIPIDNAALEIIVRRGGGSFRDSLSLLDQVATLSDQEITAPLLNHALGLPATDMIQTLLSAYSAQDTATLHQTLKSLINSGLKPEIIASELISAILEQPLPPLLSLLEKLPDVQAPFPEVKLLLALIPPERTANSSSTAAAASNLPSNIETGNQSVKNHPNHGENEGQNAQNSPQNVENIAKITNNSPQEPISASNPADRPPTAVSPEPTLKSPENAPEITKNTEKLNPNPENSLQNNQKSPENTQNAPETPLEAPNSASSANPPSQPTPAPNPSKSPNLYVSGNSLNWNALITALREHSAGVSDQLRRSQYEFENNALEIYPPNKFGHDVINKPNNIQLISSLLPGVSLVVHPHTEHPRHEDSTISQISAIMGNIQEVNNDEPF